ncbi:MAG: dicarboxylate/amino acid:cation symporter [Novosphingobium sp.]|nr:dicarboxylate/amino acid:cation symporter [Novosphingobium sp.]
MNQPINDRSSGGEASASSTLPQITRVPTLWTFVGLICGLGLGLALTMRAPGALAPLLAVAEPLGDMWLRALRATIIPLVVSLLFMGMVQTVAAARAGAMARRALGWFYIILAGGSAMAAFLVPALLVLFPSPPGAAEALRSSMSAAISQTAGPLPGAGDFVASFVPANVFASAANDAILPLLLFTAAFAVAAARLGLRQRDSLLTFFEGVGGATLIVVGWILWTAPVGVFALSFAVAAHTGAAAIGALAHYVLIVTLTGTVMFLSAYPIAAIFGRQPLGAFARAVIPAQALALSTQSSLASLPAMLGACRQLGIRDRAAEFTLPLAVALFRGTGPAMNFAVAIYLAHWLGVPVDGWHMVAGFAVASVMSFGAVSLPGAISLVTSCGPIALAMGVPVGPLALLVAVEVLPDLMRTLGNVTLDVAVTAVVDAMPGLDDEQAASD